MMKKIYSAHSAEIKKMIRESYEWLYANKFASVDKTDYFLETYNLPILI